MAADCKLRDSSTVAAQWIRAAYHDMSTHNVEDGTGGLDGSIRFELTDRPQNVGVGMFFTIAELSNFETPYVSFADLLSMAAIAGYGSCGGPSVASIPFRAGRIDAPAAGPATVPEPQQDLESHIASFKRQGFTQSEMITLVACGHTVGGVRKIDFETITPDQDFALFHGAQTYDKSVVTGYLDGTTPNPLVVSPNVTMRSDLRIFGSDGNVTMQRLAQGDTFNTECASLIERMIDTVPKEVTLTEPILPIEYKVGHTRLYPSKDSNSLVLATSLRTLDRNDKRTITLFWQGKAGEAGSIPSTSVLQLSNDGQNGFSYLGISATKYHFQLTVNSTTSPSKFWFEIDEGDGSEKKKIDNGGNGFTVGQDEVLFDPVRSQRVLDSQESFSLFTLAVKSTGKTVAMRVFEPVTGGLPIVTVIEPALDTTYPPTPGYTFLSARISIEATSVDLLVDGEVVQEFVDPIEILTRVFPNSV
ncbi:hypothetical protein V5O48_018897 [Marasmius crinis-equi]|uniref:Peroxidase n=1 Tax=Marasmius crinis-equi TaxID=585013 RepID=A0ABR3EJX3_9AGAR